MWSGSTFSQFDPAWADGIWGPHRVRSLIHQFQNTIPLVKIATATNDLTSQAIMEAASTAADMLEAVTSVRTFAFGRSLIYLANKVEHKLIPVAQASMGAAASTDDPPVQNHQVFC